MKKKTSIILAVASLFTNPIVAQGAFQDHTDLYRGEGTFDSVIEHSEEIPEKELVVPEEEPVDEDGEFDTFYRRHGTFDSVVEDPPEIEESEKAADDEGGPDSKINEYVDFGGTIEVEAYSERDYDCKRHSDIALEAAELDFEITLHECARGFVAIEYDGDYEEILIKEAFAIFGDTDWYPYFVQIGRIFVPFGIGTGALVGDTLSISDPLTIDIFETREDVILVGARSNGFYGGIYVFNGDTFRNWRHDHIDQYGGTIRYHHENCRYSINAGFDVISSVLDSDNIRDEIPEALYAGGYPKGLAAHVRLFSRGFSLIAEFNGTFKRRTFYVAGEDDEPPMKVKLEPKAWQLELGYQREIFCKTTYVAANYSESRGMYGYFPRSRFLATFGRWIYEDVLLALEYGHDVDYPVKHGGTGGTADFFVMQLAYEW